MSTARAHDSLVARVVRAARLDDELYREVATDPRATAQAFLVVLSAGLLGGIGGLSAGTDIVLLSVLLAPLGWVLTAVLAQLIGTRVIGAEGSASWEQVARALGFAHAPALLGALAIVPVLGIAVALVLVVWRVAAMTVAIRASMGIGTGQAAMILVLSAVTLGVVIFSIDWIATGGGSPAP